MRVGLSMSAAHIHHVTADKKQNRQPEGAPNSTGGQFANEPKTEASSSAVIASRIRADAVDRLRSSYEVAEQMAAYVNGQRQQLAVTLAKAEILAKWPTATKAYLFRSYDANDDIFHLEQIADADGTTIFDADDRIVSVYDIDQLISVVDDGYTDYQPDNVLSELESRGGVATTLDLTTVDLDRLGIGIPDIADIVGVKNLDTGKQYRLLNAAAEETGQVIIPSGKSEFEYYLDENWEELGIDEDTGAKLDAKYGDREAALTALIDQPASWDYDEEAPDLLIKHKEKAILKAIEQALAAEVQPADQ